MTKLQKDATLILQDKEARIVALIDELGERTEETEEACSILYQFTDDRRPEGVEQTYHVMGVSKGSLILTATN